MTTIAPPFNEAFNLPCPWNVYIESLTTKWENTSSKLATSSSKRNLNERDKWLATIQPIFKFSTVNDFWCWFDNTAVPSCFPDTLKSLRVFRSSAGLSQEDDSNRYGGKITFIRPTIDGEADRCWLRLLLLVLSDSAISYPPSLINGVVAKRSKMAIKFEIWLSSDLAGRSTTLPSEIIECLTRAIIPSTYFAFDANITRISPGNHSISAEDSGDNKKSLSIASNVSMEFKYHY
jgi:hypothetical protein